MHERYSLCMYQNHLKKKSKIVTDLAQTGLFMYLISFKYV